MGNTIIDFSSSGSSGNTYSLEENNFRREHEVYLDLDILSTPIQARNKSFAKEPKFESYYAFLGVHPEQNVADRKCVLLDEDGRWQDVQKGLLISLKEDDYDKQMLRYRMNSTEEYRLQKDINVQAIFNSIRNIFTWIPGERVLNPEFGSKLRKYLYEGITERNVEQIISEIKSTCLKWEPRISILKVKNASTVEDTENNNVRLNIVFTIPSLSDEEYSYSYIYNRSE